ncbi:hypothetical protein ACUODJ_61800, partial [Escherichia sp. HC-CC]
TALAPDRIDKLVAIDIAPVDYHVRRHDEIFAAINAVSESDAQTRQQFIDAIGGQCSKCHYRFTAHGVTDK